MNTHAQGSTLLDWLRQGRQVLEDGAMGTMLQAAGLPPGASPELWNVEQPDKVQAVHRGYVDAGSMIIGTNTFGGNRVRLEGHGLADRMAELNRAGARLARAVAPAGAVLVAGSVGPTGQMMEPLGPLSADAATALFAQQVEALLEGGVDFILIETMSDLAEVQAAIQGARQVNANVLIAATLTFDRNGRTMMGVRPQQALEALHEQGIPIMGANCGNGPQEIEAVMEQLAARRPEGVYLMAQSNAGLPHDVEGKLIYDGTPAVMAAYAQRAHALGVNVIGACCGSTPVHIAAMRTALFG